ncbi:hypothetical protein HYU23_02010 [Candidatus Woesearchaeota archaeon]|nr:hypothetical protein [Candidatus Woesearchaeota archaeon]
MDYKIEVKRKIFHMISGLILVLLIDLGIFNALILGIILILGIFLSLLTNKIKIPLIYWCLKHLDRKNDLNNYPGIGAITFILGCFLSLILFEKNIALASIMVLTIGDSISYLVGTHFGRTTHPLNKNKLLEGTVAGIVFAFFGALIFVNYKEALIASIFGMLIESVELRLTKKLVIDDNITVPLISGLAIYLFRLF